MTVRWIICAALFTIAGCGVEGAPERPGFGPIVQAAAR